MNKENTKKWVDALRSGRFKQGHGGLCNIDGLGENFYCCLGVACEVYQEEVGDLVIRVSGEDDYRRYDGYAAILPKDVKDWLDLSYEYEEQLVHLNDDKQESFQGIADIIEGWMNSN